MRVMQVHISAAAHCSSSRTEKPNSRGVEKYTGYATRSENARNPERMSHGRVARKRYKSNDHRGPVEVLGQGWITGHQNKSPVPKNIACSTVCPISDRTPSANNVGTCQAIRVSAEAVQHSTGFVTIRASRWAIGLCHTRPSVLRANSGVMPQNIFMGSPNRIKGGAKVISSRCLIMWTVSRLWS